MIIVKHFFYYDSMFERSNIKDKNFMHGFDIIKVFKLGNPTRGIAELTSSALLSKELDVTYWRKFMTDPEIEEAAKELNYYVYKKSNEELIIMRLNHKAIKKLRKQKKQREGEMVW